MNRSERRKQQRHRAKTGHAEPALGSLVNVDVTPASLLDRIEDGREYGSIVDLLPDNLNLADELVRAAREIQAVRGRDCIFYVGNVVRPLQGSSVDAGDDVPFHEAVQQFPPDGSVDVFLATNGGSAHQVSRFVHALRQRFASVEFLIPSFCMSAGTLFALSGDRIWMTSRACLGPIDPQVPAAGRFVPAQALLLLVEKLRQEGTESLRNTGTVPWTAVRIIDSLDKKELADAMTASQYGQTMATEFLTNYKFRDWTVTESTGRVVDSAARRARAEEIAVALGSHDKWKAHGHAISREVLYNEIQLRIDHPAPDLERVMTRAWALLTWIFEKTPIAKAIISTRDYRFFRLDQTTGQRDGKG
jgi:hypothetical protein